MLVLMLPGNIIAQSDPTYIEAENGDAEDSSAVSKHSLFTGLGYGSNMIWLGSTISQNQPFGYGALTYGFNSELYVTLSAVHLSDTDPFLAFYTGSINYNHVFNNWFDISAGLYRYEVVPSLSDTLFGSFSYADFIMGFDWKLIYTKISLGGLMSYDNQLYIQIRNSRYFQTPDFFKGKANISFDPYVNLLMGTYTQAETTNGPPVVIFPPFRKWRTETQATTTTYTRRFGIIDIDLGLPVALNTDRMSIEAEAGYVFPVYKDSEYPQPEGFLFLLSAYLRIF
ncbi:MAG TPA: hypothetical protein VK861_03580 [Bacteroidales bacterium]|nr:hypothetical protein [Bacteroidales bacterium]